MSDAYGDDFITISDEDGKEYARTARSWRSAFSAYPPTRTARSFWRP